MIEQRSKRPPDRPGELDQLRRELIINPEAPWYRHVANGAEIDTRWDGYQAEVLSVDQDQIIQWAGFPWHKLLPWADVPQSVVRWRVWNNDGAVLTLSWRPHRRRSWLTIEGPGRTIDQKTAGKLISLVRQTQRRGRPRKLTADEAKTIATEARRLMRERSDFSRLDIVYELRLVVVDEDEELAVGQAAIKKAESTAKRRLRRILADHPA